MKKSASAVQTADSEGRLLSYAFPTLAGGESGGVTAVLVKSM